MSLVYSAHVGDNAGLFPEILRLHVPDGAAVADVTYGLGSFWKRVDTSKYQCYFTDKKTGTDCRFLPYDDGTMGCVVFDPPYMEGFYRDKKTSLAWGGDDIGSRFSDDMVKPGEDVKYHARVVKFYGEGMAEAHRVLRRKGVLIVKCQDEVSNHRQHLTHVEIIVNSTNIFYCKDIFVLVQSGRPAVRPGLKKQQHARKCHSYFLVFEKK